MLSSSKDLGKGDLTVYALLNGRSDGCEKPKNAGSGWKTW